jgi:hypothetical protein
MSITLTNELNECIVIVITEQIVQDQSLGLGFADLVVDDFEPLTYGRGPYVSGSKSADLEPHKVSQSVGGITSITNYINPR